MYQNVFVVTGANVNRFFEFQALWKNTKIWNDMKLIPCFSMIASNSLTMRACDCVRMVHSQCLSGQVRRLIGNVYDFDLKVWSVAHSSISMCVRILLQRDWKLFLCINLQRDEGIFTKCSLLLCISFMWNQLSSVLVFMQHNRFSVVFDLNREKKQSNRRRRTNTTET